MNDAPFDVSEVDRLLSTTRAVRKRLDFDRPVSDQLIFDCIDAAEQAPSGGNDASRRWMVVRDPEIKERLGAMYKEGGAFLARVADRMEGTGHPKEKVFDSSAHLLENFGKAPALVIVAIWGIHDNSGRPGLFDSVVQSAWSFNLALRARGLGSAWTTILNGNVEGLAAELGIPRGVTTIVTFPVAYTKGTDFSPVPRRPAAEITYFDQWGFTRRQASADGTARVADGPGVVAEVDVEARPKALWPLISDIGLPAQFSQELESAEWTSEGHEMGGTFVGHNKMGDMQWSVPNEVTDYQENRVFEWSNAGAVWRLETTEQGMGTRLRFSMLIGAEGNGTSAHALEDPDKEERRLNRRRQVLKANMQASIDGIKELAEQR